MDYLKRAVLCTYKSFLFYFYFLARLLKRVLFASMRIANRQLSQIPSFLKIPSEIVLCKIKKERVNDRPLLRLQHRLRQTVR